jgi:hypothetical protein
LFAPGFRLFSSLDLATRNLEPFWPFEIFEEISFASLLWWRQLLPLNLLSRARELLFNAQSAAKKAKSWAVLYSGEMWGRGFYG